MCWIIDKAKFNDNPEQYHKIADNDIIVYKVGQNFSVFDNRFFPYFQRKFSYKPHKENKEIKLVLKEVHIEYIAPNGLEIKEGYHSFSGDCVINGEGKQGFVNYFYETYLLYGLTIGVFVIPKGTEYYEDEDGEIVSSNIKWTGRISRFSEIPFKENIKIKDCVLTNYERVI